MKNFLLFPLLFVSLSLFAQGGPPIFQDLVIIPSTISDENGAFGLKWEKNALKYESEGFRPYEIESVKIIGTDLEVRLKANQIYKEQLSYNLSLMMEDAYGIRLNPALSDISTKKSFDFTWEGFTENILPSEEDYSLFLRTEIGGDICNQVPAFEFKEKLPYVLAGVGGAGLIIAGQLTNRSALANYETYENIWLTGGEESDAISFEEIKQQEDNSRTLSLIGGSILIADLVMYLLGPNKKFNMEKRLFGAYCGEQNKVEIHPTLNASTGVGYQIQINF